jgi:hypothetical protein
MHRRQGKQLGTIKNWRGNEKTNEGSNEATTPKPVDQAGIEAEPNVHSSSRFVFFDGSSEPGEPA